MRLTTPGNVSLTNRQKLLTTYDSSGSQPVSFVFVVTVLPRHDCAWEKTRVLIRNPEGETSLARSHSVRRAEVTVFVSRRCKFHWHLDRLNARLRSISGARFKQLSNYEEWHIVPAGLP
jgi:hypothetical protein